MGSMITGESNPDEYEENFTLLRQEQEKEKPSKKIIRQLMKATHQGIVCITCVYRCLHSLLIIFHNICA